MLIGPQILDLFRDHQFDEMVTRRLRGKFLSVFVRSS
jgi:hypothetical protein